MVCCLCEEATWTVFKDHLYYVEPILVEELHGLLRLDLCNLSQLINLINIYYKARTSIRAEIERVHSYCQYCVLCGNKSDSGPDSEEQDNIIDAVCNYYLGLTGLQSKVLHKLSSCVDEMVAIDQMIGMDTIKSDFVRLLKFLAAVTREDLDKQSFMMHMVIMGPPGHGKTEIAKMLGNAFRKSGLLSSDEFVLARRSDLIGAYCGHTAKATTEMFDKAKGGVIFIDEVYALGNPEKRDVFTGECINTINQLLSERTDTLCIIAGYEKEIQTCFFSYNPGLERRFPWRFKIREYSNEDLVEIFYKKVKDSGLEIFSGSLTPSDIEKNRDMFPNAGGDMVTLVTNCTLAYYENSFMGLSGRPMTRNDVLLGLQRYLENRGQGKVKELPPPHGMYT